MANYLSDCQSSPWIPGQSIRAPQRNFNVKSCTFIVEEAIEPGLFRRLFNWILGITEIPFVGVERWPDHRNLSPEEQLWSPEEKKNHWEKKKTKKQKKAQQMDLKKSSGQEDLDQVNLEKALVKFEEKKKQQEAQQMGLKKALRQEELEKLEENKKYKEVQQMGLEKVWWHVTLDMETKELLEEASEKLAKKTEP